jgi:hypothetical protein
VGGHSRDKPAPTGLPQASGIASGLWEAIRGTSLPPKDYHRLQALRLICGRSFAGQARSHRIITGCRHCEWSVGGHSRDKPAPTGLSQAGGIASGLWEAIRGTSLPPQDYHRLQALRVICERPFAGQARSHRIITGRWHCEWSVGGHSRGKPAPTGSSQAAGIASDLWEAIRGTSLPHRIITGRWHCE